MITLKKIILTKNEKIKFDPDIDLDLWPFKYWFGWPFKVLSNCWNVILSQNHDLKNLTILSLKGHTRSTGSSIWISIPDLESWGNFLSKWYQFYSIWTTLSRDLLSGHDISKTVRDIKNLFSPLIFYFFIRNRMKNTRIKNIEEWPRKLKKFKKYKNWPSYWPLT